jgi:hypothetical protein
MTKIAICILLLWSAQLRAQKPAEDFAAVYNAYLSDYLWLDFEVKVYSDKNDKTGTSAGKGIVRRAGDKYFSSYNGQEFLTSSDGMLMVDSESKSISYFKKGKKEERVKTNAAGIDSTILANADSVVYKGSVSGKKHYRIYDSSMPTHIIDLYIDTKTNLIASIVYYYKESTSEASYEMHKMVITYSTANTAPFPAGQYFSPSKYITIGKKIVPVGSYSSYKLKIIQ